MQASNSEEKGELTLCVGRKTLLTQLDQKQHDTVAHETQTVLHTHTVYRNCTSYARMTQLTSKNSFTSMGDTPHTTRRSDGHALGSEAASLTARSTCSQ